jgi:hypothetical protein
MNHPIIHENLLLDTKEEIGICKKCHKEDYLGEGLCQKCWDRTIGKNRYYVPAPAYNLDGTKVQKQKCYIARVKCRDCGKLIDSPTVVGERPSKAKRCRSCNQKRWKEYTQRKMERLTEVE